MRILRHIGNEPRCILLAHGREVFSKEVQPSGLWGKDLGQQLEQRGLPGPVRPHDTQNLPGLDQKIHIVEYPSDLP